MNWTRLNSNEEGDWINQRNDVFDSYFLIASKDKKEASIFNINSNGVVTSRDAWVYGFSKWELEGNMKSTINFYNSQLRNLKLKKKSNSKIEVEDFIDTDETKISWSRALKQALNSDKERLLDKAGGINKKFQALKLSPNFPLAN